ncbi:MAG: N-acetylmuramoyl-L-alanine amidase [Candidatus Omnitrophica bacterium]|nr:N-acetylmuramoyl-L-alanine amidase [Candidatus Omnitrophota bacterium]MDD5670707.1 N-acetylmuramoyl-L-alanine amidase [Candidatus Omnitrophota bacterium]
MKKHVLLSILLIPVLLNSCTSVPVTTLVTQTPVYSLPTVPVLRQDVKHIVAPGETLWRIGKMYDVPVDEIMRTNHLKDSATLSMGQSLLIPKASPLRSIIPLYPNPKWKFIIIHHSATDEGDSLSFNRHHLKRGFAGGVGYHFVIDNGSHSKVDGQIEVAPRWLKQEDGRHCKASEMNCKAIGVCLVGNFNAEKLSSEQMKSLVYLVNTLRKYYKIPPQNIMEHGQVPGANTDCPGKHFPWQEFKSALGAS